MQNKISLIKYKKLRQTLALPFILAVALPLIILDIGLEIYHRICFPLYGLASVKRGEYIKIDRHKLAYLNFWDKIWCAYCGYANGLLGYAVAIAGETERYWCAIKHQKYARFHQPTHHQNFLEYGDEKGFREKYEKPQDRLHNNFRRRNSRILDETK